MPTARLRKAFRYPDDSGGEFDHEELDEEEQEFIIQRLQVQNDRRNAEYSTLFAAIPFISTMAFIPSIVWGGINMSERCCSILSVLSLVTTAYIMKYIPLRHLGPNGKRPMQGLKFVAYVHKYAIPVNTAICGFLLFVYMLTAPMESSGNNQPAAYLVPGVMLAIIMIARKVMVSVDLDYLENLRYRYKGA